MIRRYLLCLITCICASAFWSCEKDNFDAPSSSLKGQVVYEGAPVGVRSNGVQLELWQPGYAFNEKIPVYVAQDGSFSAALFDGNYKLVLLRGNGPWVDKSDTINVQLRGASEVTVPVEPYYMIRQQSFVRKGNAIEATFSLQQINSSKAVERVSFYVATTTIVDANNSAARIDKPAAEITDLTAPITLSINLPDNLVNREYVFVRIGVKTVGVAEMLFTPVEKLNR